MDAKQIAAETAALRVEDGMIVGLGSGSTAEHAIRKIGERVRAGLRIQAVASSRKSEALAKAEGITVLDPGDVVYVDLGIDGADEVDPRLNLLKGGGGSLLREKILAYASRAFIVMVDDTKLVARLGIRAVPLEVTPFGLSFTARHLASMGGDPVLRLQDNQPFITDNGNVIIDCKFPSIDDPAALDVRLKMIPGVVETGLFPHKLVTAVLVGSADGRVNERFPAL